MGEESRAHLQDMQHEVEKALHHFGAAGGTFAVNQQISKKVNANRIKSALYTTLEMDLFVEYKKFMASQLQHGKSPEALISVGEYNNSFVYHYL